jgi:hypothetical protein
MDRPILDFEEATMETTLTVLAGWLAASIVVGLGWGAFVQAGERQSALPSDLVVKASRAPRAPYAAPAADVGRSERPAA